MQEEDPDILLRKQRNEIIKVAQERMENAQRKLQQVEKEEAKKMEDERKRAQVTAAPIGIGEQKQGPFPAEKEEPSAAPYLCGLAFQPECGLAFQPERLKKSKKVTAEETLRNEVNNLRSMVNTFQRKMDEVNATLHKKQIAKEVKASKAKTASYLFYTSQAIAVAIGLYLGVNLILATLFGGIAVNLILSRAFKMGKKITKRSASSKDMKSYNEHKVTLQSRLDNLLLKQFNESDAQELQLKQHIEALIANAPDPTFFGEVNNEFNKVDKEKQQPVCSKEQVLCWAVRKLRRLPTTTENKRIKLLEELNSEGSDAYKMIARKY